MCYEIRIDICKYKLHFSGKTVYSRFRLIGPPVNRTSRLFGPNPKEQKQILWLKLIFDRLFGPKFRFIGPKNIGKNTEFQKSRKFWNFLSIDKDLKCYDVNKDHDAAIVSRIAAKHVTATNEESEDETLMYRCKYLHRTLGKTLKPCFTISCRKKMKAVA